MAVAAGLSAVEAAVDQGLNPKETSNLAATAATKAGGSSDDILEVMKEANAKSEEKGTKAAEVKEKKKLKAQAAQENTEKEQVSKDLT